MRVQVQSDSVHLTLPMDEADRLASALLEGGGDLSRAEYFIRTGLAKPNVTAVGRSLFDALRDGAADTLLSLAAGVGEVEAPPHDRPRRDV